MACHVIVWAMYLKVITEVEQVAQPAQDSMEWQPVAPDGRFREEGTCS